MSCNDSCIFSDPCFPIPVPHQDPSFTEGCINFRRNSPACFSGKYVNTRCIENYIKEFMNEGEVFQLHVIGGLTNFNNLSSVPTKPVAKFGSK